MATDRTGAGSNLFQPLRHANPFWGEAIPPIVDLTNVTLTVWEDATDDVDLAVVKTVTGVGGAVALWRAYRRDADDSAAPLRPVYVAEVEDPEAVSDVAATSAAAGADAAVEFFSTGAAVSPHAQAALGGSADQPNPPGAGGCVMPGTPSANLQVCSATSPCDEVRREVPRAARTGPEDDLGRGPR